MVCYSTQYSNHIQEVVGSRVGGPRPPLPPVGGSVGFIIYISMQPAIYSYSVFKLIHVIISYLIHGTFKDQLLFGSFEDHFEFILNYLFHIFTRELWLIYLFLMLSQMHRQSNLFRLLNYSNQQLVQLPPNKQKTLIL